VDNARNLCHAGQTCQSTGNHENEDGVGCDVDTSIAGSTGVITNEGDLVAPFAAVDDQIDDDRGDQPEENADVQSHTREGRYLLGIVRQARQPGYLGEGLGHLEAGFTPIAEDPIIVPEHGNVVEHQGGDDFVDVEFCLEDAGNEGI